MNNSQKLLLGKLGMSLNAKDISKILQKDYPIVSCNGAKIQEVRFCEDCVEVVFGAVFENDSVTGLAYTHTQIFVKLQYSDNEQIISSADFSGMIDGTLDEIPEDYF